MLSTKIKRIIMIFAIIILIILALFLGFRLGYSFIAQQNERDRAIAAMELASQNATDQNPLISVTPVPQVTDENGEPYELPRHIHQDTPGAIEVYIEPGMDIGDIADLLESKGVIDQTLPFQVMAELNGFDGTYQLGTHFVLEGMDYNEIMFNLTQDAETIWVTFPEGFAYTDIKARLIESGININEQIMDELMNSPSTFTGYSFISDIPTDAEDRIYILEGYLFPDTYQFDLNVSEEDIIRTMLRNTDVKLTAEIRDRAEAIGMSIDDTLTLASVIQGESGVIQEEYLISRVFHNRLDQGIMLQSDATINYLRHLQGLPKVWASSNTDMAMDSRYNSYRYEGLPPGPIGNPGIEAIKAALYPDTTERDLLYFVAKGDGTTAFASTWAEHERNIELYSGNWTSPRD